MPFDTRLLELLPDPVLLVGPDGRTLSANRAFFGLAARHGVDGTLAALFGPPAAALLAEAVRTGRASGFVPVIACADASQGFRLTIAAGDEGTLVVQLADLSEEVAWRHQLFLRNSELTVLNDIGMALSGTLEMNVLAHRIWEQAGRMMDNTNFFLALHDRETSTIQFPLWVEDGQVLITKRSRPFRNSVTEYMVGHRQPMLLNGDVGAQLAALGMDPIGRPCLSFAGVPILSGGEAVGVIALQDHETEGRFGPHELELLNIVGTQASSAIRNARLFETTRRAYDELSAAQTQLLESERLKGVTETVGALNHEVNNPLATIVGTAQLLLRADKLDLGTRAKVERMLEAAKRIQDVTGRMSSLIQATSRPYPGQTQILDLRRSLAQDDSQRSAPGIPREALDALRARAIEDARAAEPPSGTPKPGQDAPRTDAA